MNEIRPDDPCFDHLTACLRKGAPVCRLATVADPSHDVPVRINVCNVCGGKHDMLLFSPLPTQWFRYSHAAVCPATGDYIKIHLDPDYYVKGDCGG